MLWLKLLLVGLCLQLQAPAVSAGTFSLHTFLSCITVVVAPLVLPQAPRTCSQMPRRTVCLVLQQRNACVYRLAGQRALQMSIECFSLA